MFLVVIDKKGDNIMIDVPEMIKKAIKKELYLGKDELNQAARNVLGDMKTKFIDIKEEITDDIQYKMLQKMKKDKENAVAIYSEAFNKTLSDIAKENRDKYQNELIVVDDFLEEVGKNMPKKYNEEETRNVIKEIINNAGGNVNKGIIMKSLKTNDNIDMALASKLVNEFL